jgi:hypothetical protein
MNTQRRTFILVAAGISAAATTACSTMAPSDANPMVSDTDAVAVALGYSGDATKTDVKKFPQYAAGQSCASCVLYSGATGSGSAACQAFGGKRVAAKGWCSAWVKKA